jgi:hypothetical protein
MTANELSLDLLDSQTNTIRSCGALCDPALMTLWPRYRFCRTRHVPPRQELGLWKPRA